MAERERDVRVRLVQDRDLEGINSLLRAERFRHRSAASWRWLFHDNPARRPDDPVGWLVEVEGQVRGYLGNIPQRYALGERTIRAATCTAYCVQPEGRTQSVNLLQAWFRQRGVDLFLSTTANVNSGPLYRMFKAETPPGDCFREAYIWLTHDQTLLQAGLSWLGLPGALSRPLSRLTAPLVRQGRGWIGLATLPPARLGTPPAITRIHQADVGEAFDDLWAAVRLRGGLRTWRDAAVLRWVMADPDLRTPLLLFAAHQQGTLAGYALSTMHHAGAIKLPTVRLLDLVVRPGHEGIERALLRASLEEGAALGAGIAYCSPSGPELAALLRETRPYIHHRAHDAHFIRTVKKSGLPDPAAPGLWQATPFDGDIPFILTDNLARP